MKFVLFLSSLFFPLLSQISASDPASLESLKEENMKSLVDIGNDYMALLNRIGAEQNLSHQNKASSLCAPHCKKIVNGALWYQGVDNFVPQLLSTAEKVGFWTIEPLDVISSQDGRTIALRFLVRTEKAGIWNTCVILRCDDALFITEINEVFNSYEGAH
jgi:hypothetical protein